MPLTCHRCVRVARISRHLIDYLLSKINLDLHKKIVGVSGEMMEKFMTYSWPGNIRELENLLVRACVVAKGQVLGVGDFPELGKDDPSIVVRKDETSGCIYAGPAG